MCIYTFKKFFFHKKTPKRDVAFVLVMMCGMVLFLRGHQCGKHGGECDFDFKRRSHAVLPFDPPVFTGGLAAARVFYGICGRSDKKTKERMKLFEQNKNPGGPSF